MLASRLGLVTALLGLAACPATDPSTGLTLGASEALLDYNGFICDVMPTLVRRCSYSACHGNTDHALRVYSPGKLRIGEPSTRDGRDAQLTADEITRNFESAVGLTRAASAEARARPLDAQIPLLSKPLAARFGGAEHHDVGIFPVYPHLTPDDDPEWQQLVSWVRGDKQPQPPTQACADFFTALGMVPR